VWEKQWARVNRWYLRFRAIDAGVEHNEPTDFHQDEMWSFFVNCYHFKDWLKNDTASGVSEKDVEDYVNQSPNLSLCGDVANGSKHAVLTWARVDKNTKLKNQKFKFELHAGLGDQNPPPKVAVKYVLEANGVTYDAFGLATDCLNDWDVFLKSKGLPTNF
jgi:hypothetical protein